MSNVYSGRCLVWPHEEGAQPHLWIALTDPAGDPPQVVVVNLTSRRPNSDTTVVLQIGDHRFIKRETVVSYADARLVDSDVLETYAKTPGNRFDDDCSEALLRQIREGLLNSRFTPRKIKAYCAARF
jgi:hypothetical protein